MPYRNEAQELRVILESLAYASPAMTLDEAVPMIFEIEKRTAELKPAETRLTTMVKLPDMKPETGAKFIELQTDIIDHIVSGRMINGIKEFCGRTGWGLKESKEACEYFRNHYTVTSPVSFT